ncbi:MAG TPA: hypothetical protein VJ903_02200, partial [Clostridia bacterium]|nr:hypothetical protein [Clostridia bacterium]
LLLVLITIFALTACNNNNEEDDLQPLPATTISVKNAEDLANIKDCLGIRYSNYTFSLENDLDLSDYIQWESIGTKENPFMGTLLGNGKIISNLTYLGMDDSGKPTVANEQENIALFGFTQNATITDIKLSDINLKLYTYGDFFHTAGLVAYNTGKSTFSNINITGRIDLSNIYVYNTTYGMDGKVQDDRVVACDTTQYIGGLVAYSSGKSNFNDIDVDIDINNKHYRAVYEIEEELVDGNTVVVKDGYNVHTFSNQSYLPHQTLAGFLGGYIKNGAIIDGVNVTGSMEIYSKSVYGASGAAILVGSKASNINSNDSNLVLKGSEKVGGSGIVALIDSSCVTTSKVNTLSISAEPIGGSIKSIGIGGIASYCYDRAILTDSEVVGFSASTTEKEKLQLGGVVGVVRDSTVSGNKTSGTFKVSGSNKVDNDSYLHTASVIYAAYGNAIVQNNQASISNTLKNGDTYMVKNNNIYGVSNNTPYVNEDGKNVARFAHTNDVKNYVEVSVVNETQNEVKATFHNSEGKELGQIVYSVDESLFPAEGENWSRYMSVYYNEEIGLINANGTTLELDGNSFANYKQITGIPMISDNIITD